MRSIVDEFLTLTAEEEEYGKLYAKGLSPAFPPYIREKGGIVTLDEELFVNSRFYRVVKHPCFLPRYMHDHSFVETALVLAGSCTQELNGESFIMKEGDSLIIAPGHFHSISVFDEKTVVLNLIVSLEAISLIAPLFGEDRSKEASFILSLASGNPVSSALLVHGNEGIAPCLDRLVKGPESSSGTLALLASFFAVLFDSRHDFEFFGQKDKKTMRLALALSLIRNNPREMTLTWLADRMQLSPAYLSALIPAATGLKFSELVTRRRMEVACSLLAKENAVSLEDVADRIGYGSAQHFCRKFKSWAGMTPMEWRKSRLREDRTSL
jgi:AraC-type DNA-binding domain-containing proteins